MRVSNNLPSTATKCQASKEPTDLQFRQLIGDERTESSVWCIEETNTLGLGAVQSWTLNLQRHKPGDGRRRRVGNWVRQQRVGG